MAQQNVQKKPVEEKQQSVSRRPVEERIETLVRIMGQDIPGSRNIYAGLTRIKGISRALSLNIFNASNELKGPIE